MINKSEIRNIQELRQSIAASIEMFLARTINKKELIDIVGSLRVQLTKQSMVSIIETALNFKEEKYQLLLKKITSNKADTIDEEEFRQMEQERSRMFSALTENSEFEVFLMEDGITTLLRDLRA